MRPGRHVIPALPTVAAGAMALLAAVFVPLLPTYAQGNAASCANGIAVPNPSDNPGLVSDCEALLSARDTLAGTASLNWSSTTAIDQWDGVTVGDTSQRVTELSLPERQLTGRVAPELGRLSGLQLLDLLGNGLSGNMPRELARLASLRSLSVSNNRLSGEIPAELGNLTELITLDLAFNRLSGPIPPELGRLSHLTRLKIDHNQLTGEIPSELLSLSNLSWLFLGDNHLTGRIPPDLGRLARLSLLDLGTNQFTGPIPPELGRLTGLIRLDLDQNQLDGQIPPQLGSLSDLDILRLSGNQLTGQIPPELAGLSKLDWLLLSHNQLTGEVPPDLGRLASLTLLDLGGNRLTGQIPPELGDLSQLDGLSLHSNKLTGGIPAELGRLSKLHSLSLDGNRLSGPIPPELRGLTNVVVVELRNNELSGEIPSALGSLVNLEALYLSNNRLIGEIPAELGTLPNLDLVNLSGNKLTGCVPGRLRAVESNDLARLGLPFCAVALDDDDEASCSNGIAVPGPDDNPGLVSDCEALLAARDTLAGTGSLDWSAGVPIGQWDGVGLGGTPKRVARLNLSARQLTGEIPVELGDLANLDTLGLDYNRLTGGIPPELGHLPNLFWLLLTGNRLTGQIPPGLGRNASLDVLDLGGNQLTGQIPPELGDLSNLSTLALNNNKLTGEIPAELGRLSTLFSLYLNGNRLSGPIPPELRGLVNVVVVDLRGNELSGEIPSALGSLVNLESLSLSDNRLIGEIPAELGTLKNLDLVHLSDNRLNGCVPGGLRVAYYNDFDRLRLPFCDLLLNDLVVTPGSLTPPFDRYHTDYTAEVSTPIVTILPTGGHNAALQVLGGDDHELEDADSNLPGIQVAAGAAFIRITVRVVAADGKATRTYTIGIRRVLGAPTAAAVEAGGGYLAVSWAAPDEFAEARTASYDLRYIPTADDEAVDANWTVVENVPTYSAGGNLQYTITGLGAGIQYEVQVRAVDRDGEPAAWSASVTGTPTTPSVCVTGGAIAVVINPGIVSDCESLLAARDALGWERPAQLVGECAHQRLGRRHGGWDAAPRGRPVGQQQRAGRDDSRGAGRPDRPAAAGPLREPVDRPDPGRAREARGPPVPGPQRQSTDGTDSIPVGVLGSSSASWSEALLDDLCDLSGNDLPGARAHRTVGAALLSEGTTRCTCRRRTRITSGRQPSRSTAATILPARRL